MRALRGGRPVHSLRRGVRGTRPRTPGASGHAIDLAVSTTPGKPGWICWGSNATARPTTRPARRATATDSAGRCSNRSAGGSGRAWSTDWVRDPSGESRRLLAHLDEIRDASPPASVKAPSPAIPKPPLPELYEREDPGEPGDGPSSVPVYHPATLPEDLCGVDLGAVPAGRLAEAVVSVVRAESPVHVDELSRRIADAAGVKRLAGRALSAIERACAEAVERGGGRRWGDLLWAGGRPRPVVRDRSRLPSSSRKIELIAPEELDLAVEKVVADALGIERNALPFAVCRLLGFNRMSDEMRHRLESVIRDLIERAGSSRACEEPGRPGDPPRKSA